MTELVHHYTPIEVLLLFQNLAVNGVTTSFHRISDSLKNEPLIRNGRNYDPERLNPDALKDIFLRILKEEARNEIQRAANESEPDDSQSGRKRKATSPSTAVTVDAIQDQHLIPGLVQKLYARYREHAVQELRNIEQKVGRLNLEVKEIEEGQWDARIQDEIKQGKWDHLNRKSQANGHDQPSLSTPVGPSPGATPTPLNPATQQASTPRLSQPALQPANDPRVKSPQPGQLPKSPANVSHPSVVIPYSHQTPGPQQGAYAAPPQIGQNQPQRAPSASYAAGGYPPSRATPQYQTPNQPASLTPAAARSPSPYGNQGFPPNPYASSPGPHAQNVSHYGPPGGVQTQRTASPLSYSQPQQYQGHPQGQRYMPPPQPPHHGGVVLPPFHVAPQTPHMQQMQGQAGPARHPQQVPASALPAAGRGLPAPYGTPVRQLDQNRRSTLPAQPFGDRGSLQFRNEVFKLLGTPNSSRAASARSTPARTPWKAKAVETRTASHRSPSPMRVRSISPIPADPPSLPSSDQKKRDETDAPVSQMPSPKTRGTRGRGRGRGRAGRNAGSRTSSITGASTRGRTRSQSVMSQASATHETSKSRNVKAEPSTPADTSELDTQLEDRGGETPASDRKGKGASFIGLPVKRKRGLRGASEETRSNAEDVPYSRSAIQIRPDEVLAVRNFSKLSASVLEGISTHKHASLFATPVRPNDAEGYYDMIHRPTDLKTIKNAIKAGAKAVNAALAEMEAQGTPNSATRRGSTMNTPMSSYAARDASTVLLPLSEDLVPPKGIVNSAQLEKELMRMLANAVMFNTGNEGHVQFAREMYDDISRQISGFRSAERSSLKIERRGEDADEGGEDTVMEDAPEEEREEEVDELAPEAVSPPEVRTSRRRKG